MKILIIYSVLFMSINKVFSNPALLSPYNSKEECGFNKDVFQGCSDDCSSQVFCIGNHLIELDCSLQSGGTKPYCNLTSNLCQSREFTCSNDNNNPSNPNEFQCPDQDGFYPDLLDCTKYYQCKNKVPHSDYCRDSKFNPGKNRCEKLVKCVQFSPENGLCRNKLGKYVVHPLNKNLYVKCETYPILMRCPTDNIFDLKEEECKYDCKKKGIFPDNDNEEYFYECVKVGLYWQPKHEKCPDGMIFDTDFAGCVLKQSSEEIAPEEPDNPEEPSPEGPSPNNPEVATS